jgi:RNA polymerase sigma-70 factor (ECF subfamily)
VRIAASYARTRAEREDLEQEIAVAIFRAWPRFRGECAPRTFLLRIAHNQALTFAARRKLRATVPIEDDPPDERAGADDALDDARRRARLQRAIQALPIAQRQVVLLALEGLPHDEIAAVVGIGVNNVAVRLVRAKAALRALLDDELAGRKTTGGPR